MQKKLLPKCLRKYSNMIQSISDERFSGEGFWVVMYDNYSYFGEHSAHEDTPKKCADRMADFDSI